MHRENEIMGIFYVFDISNLVETEEFINAKKYQNILQKIIAYPSLDNLYYGIKKQKGHFLTK